MIGWNTYRKGSTKGRKARLQAETYEFGERDEKRGGAQRRRPREVLGKAYTD